MKVKVNDNLVLGIVEAAAFAEAAAFDQDTALEDNLEEASVVMESLVVEVAFEDIHWHQTAAAA